MWENTIGREHCPTSVGQMHPQRGDEAIGPTLGRRRRLPADEEVDHEANA